VPRLRFGQDDVRFELRAVRCGLPTTRPEPYPACSHVALRFLDRPISANFDPRIATKVNRTFKTSWLWVQFDGISAKYIPGPE
jgi:hypothetical protein